MGNSLRDQLLKSGLVNDKQLKQAGKEKRKEQNRQHGQNTPDPKVDLQAASRQAAADKAERDRKLNQQRQETAAQKALAAQVKQLVEAHRVALEEGETAFNFADGGKVKRLYLSDALRRQITQGRLVVIRCEGRYELVPQEAAEKIRARDAGAIVLWNEAAAQPVTTQDDPYKDFVVPDDLMW
jgi:uncharacterized protein